MQTPTTRALGSSLLRVSCIGIGNMSWPGCGFGQEARLPVAADRAYVDRLVALAIEEGITLFDTAEAYGRGRGEELLGYALRAPARRAIATIVTKVGPIFNEVNKGGRLCRLERSHIISSCEASLRRLKTDYIDIYLAHWPDPLTPVEETVGAFAELKRRGLICAYGVSNFSSNLLARASKAGAISVTQNAYSLVERDFEADLRSLCHDRGIALMAYSPLAKGILAGHYSDSRLPPASDPRHRDWHFSSANFARHLTIADHLRAMAAELGTTAARLALAWCLAQPNIASVIVGGRTEEQIHDAAAAMRLRLSKQSLQYLGGLTQGWTRSAIGMR